MTATDKPVQRVTRDTYLVLFPACRKKARRVQRHNWGDDKCLVHLGY